MGLVHGYLALRLRCWLERGGIEKQIGKESRMAGVMGSQTTSSFSSLLGLVMFISFALPTTFVFGSNVKNKVRDYFRHVGMIFAYMFGAVFILWVIDLSVLRPFRRERKDRQEKRKQFLQGLRRDEEYKVLLSRPNDPNVSSALPQVSTTRSQQPPAPSTTLTSSTSRPLTTSTMTPLRTTSKLEPVRGGYSIY